VGKYSMKAMCKGFIGATLLLFVASATGSAYQIVFTQEPMESAQIEEGTKWAFSGQVPLGSRIVTLSPDGEISVLTAEFASATDPCVSFDAKRILFAGKMSSEDHWNIWEMDIDGGNKRQITKDLGDCREPEYMALSSITPPEFTDKVRWIVFTSNAANTYDEHGWELSTLLYVTNIEPIEGSERPLQTRGKC